MSSGVTYEEVLRTVQLRNEAERVRLVEELLGSLTAVDALPLDDLWLAELGRRSSELDAGAIQSIPWAEVQRKARERAKLSG